MSRWWLLVTLIIGIIIWYLTSSAGIFAKIVRHNVSTTSDHLKFPVQTISASPQPVMLPRAEHRFAIKSTDYRELMSFLQRNDTTAFIVLHDGELVIEAYFQGRQEHDISLYFSISKSVLSLLVGIALDEQYLKTTDQTLAAVLPDVKGRYVAQVNLKHLLNMRSGLAYSDYGLLNNPFGKHARLTYTTSIRQELDHLEFSHEPGTKFDYKSIDYALLGLAMHDALHGNDLADYFEKKLWHKLGAQYPAAWIIDSPGSSIERSWCCLAGSAIDLVKIGKLLLDRGKRNNQTVIPKSWFQIVFERPKNSDGLTPYHYGWWLSSSEPGAFRAEGVRGQFLYVHPSQSIVIVRLGNSRGSLSWMEWIHFFERLSTDLKA